MQMGAKYQKRPYLLLHKIIFNCCVDKKDKHYFNIVYLAYMAFHFVPKGPKEKCNVWRNFYGNILYRDKTVDA